ncbi:PREDICTED: phospholipase A2 large subunit-like [Wasmannia auropunctata]|uniref:phospholipase A2 large subunit-like n=1 Tax=Wasmannia auropunctata TaxID=64793 RepID=UPI0005EF9687|nr:PREDICTED: phospholipase A2 large subunit-like [Wasmannia auropunctata]
MRAIFPGTKWCGDGDIAANDTDLGKFKEVDACCREHDKCTINIEAGKMLGNLMNDGLFTKSACTCDSKFHSCLKATSSFMDKVIAKEIGMMYFGMLQPQCFQCMCPAEGCNLKEMDCMDGCKKYEWVDNEKF